jgi:hypothetical protein
MAVADHMVESSAYAVDDATGRIIAADLTGVMFEVLAGARPCVTCGKSIGPNKVARGYVQCYTCVRQGTVPAAPA